MSSDKSLLFIFGAVIGCLAGLISGLIGEEGTIVNGLFTGGLTGGLVAILFPRGGLGWGDPRINVAALPKAGIASGVTSSIATNAGWVGAFASCGVGGVLGLVIPPLLVATILRDFEK